MGGALQLPAWTRRETREDGRRTFVHRSSVLLGGIYDSSCHDSGGCSGWLSAFCVGQQAIAEKVPFRHTSPASGQEMYVAYCATCHGKRAKAMVRPHLPSRWRHRISQLVPRAIMASSLVSACTGRSTVKLQFPPTVRRQCRYGEGCSTRWTTVTVGPCCGSRT